MDKEALIHFTAGAIGGTVGTSMTFPIEMVKTRLQSSKFRRMTYSKVSASNLITWKQSLRQHHAVHPRYLMPCQKRIDLAKEMGKQHKISILRFTMNIIKHEGFFTLYRGLLPMIFGIAPTKAIYFYTYSTTKRFLNDKEIVIANSPIVHMLSAGFGGFISTTANNPIWMVKTRLQLHHRRVGVRECISKIYKQDGFRGFYKGLVASYIGISDTIIQFVIYEKLRKIVEEMELSKENAKLLNFTIAGGISKCCSSIITYPHDVVRTRLQEEGGKKGFFKVLSSVYKENGYKSLYRGFSLQLFRSVPNAAITMGAYEAVIYLLHNYFV
uniref:Mitochondrial carrier protein n=1 Tax=Panagrolaimus sp. JU765 TaxID=591449 RepID=A0AC34QVF2_9BILA